MMYMQWGIESKAREALEAAWALDSFNERTHFTLEVLEQLERLVPVETEHFIIKFDPKHDPGIGEFTAVFLEDMYDSVTADYGTTLRDKTIIEVFPTLRAFGVRITGKPWIHTIGASTGRVIALTSARDVAHQSPYHLARVLKHEFTHTVTLEATNNRIPHWFTEGLAVLQEDAPRSFEWGVLLADAIRRDRLFTLESIDWGFIRPRTPHDRPMAYAQSEWMCEYIVERFGYETVNAMLIRFRNGENQHQVFAEQLGLGEESFDRDFREWARKQAAQWGFDISPPEDPEAVRKLLEEQSEDTALLGRLARAHLDAGDLEPAWTAAQSALEGNEGEPNALKVMAKIISLRIADIRDDAEKKELDDLWRSILQRLDKADPDGWTAPKFLAEIHARHGELDRAAEMYARLQRVSPMDPASWRGLAGISLQRGDTEAALSQLFELARLEENNAEVPAEIAGLCRRENRLRDAQYWYRQALCVRPYDVQLHGQLADVSVQADDAKTALRHYRLLTMIEPENARHYEKAAFAAHKLGDPSESRRLAEQAVKLDPASPAQSLLP
jgi:Flp pilus assembly protein TadD